MLITTAEINTIAFLTALDVTYFKDNVMYSVQEKDLRAILGDTLQDAVNADPTSFPILLGSYIKPFLAYQIKYFTLRLINSDLIIDASYTNLTEAIDQANLMARQQKSSLQDYIYSTYGILPNSIGGFTIPSSVTSTAIKAEIMPSTEIDDLAPSEFTASASQTIFPLPQLLKRSSLVFVNEAFISPSEYTGIGTLSLNFTTVLDLNDKVIVTF